MPNKKIAIVTDSTVNLPKDLLHQYPISILPLSVIWGDKSYRDSIDIQPDEFYDRLKTTKIMPSTSQVTPNQFETVFSELLKQNYDILCIVIASKLSGTMDSAIQAKGIFPGATIELVDSQTTSLALGFQILTAARAAANGATLAECKVLVEKARINSGIFFCVETLEFLHRGGRIGAAARFLGTALNLKPILELREGEILPIERVRTQQKAHDRLIALVGERIKGHTSIRLAVIDAKAPEAADLIFKKVKQQFQAVEIIRSDVSPVLGTHTGPGTVGLGYMVDL